jgi:hydroxymethylbilane synthase
MGRLRIGTRGSALALAQAAQVEALLRAAQPQLEIETVVLRVSGDVGAARAPSGDVGVAPAVGSSALAQVPGSPADKRRWVDTIEQALLDGRIDVAVHSAKDVPAELAPGLELVAAPRRGDPRDALCGAESLAALPPGARVGTSSLRRTAQLRALREDLEPVPVRGNVDSRLRRLDGGGSDGDGGSGKGDGGLGGRARRDFDALVLARAGLQRLGRDPGVALEELVPCAGQGTLALQARAGDETVLAAVAPLRDPDTESALAAERALVRALGADCHSAVGAHARAVEGGLKLRVWVGAGDGSVWIADELAGEDPRALGLTLADRLLAVGAAELLGSSVC